MTGAPRRTSLYRRYEAVLKAPRAVPLIVGGFVARTEVGGMSLALVLLIHHTTGSYRVSGLSVAVYLVTASASRPVQGRLMDRHGRVAPLRLLTGAHLVFLVVLVWSAAGGAPAGAVLVLCGAAGATLPSLSAFVRVAWAGLPVPEDVLSTAYALDPVLYELALVCGPLLVGGLAALTPAAVPPVVLGVLALAGTVLATRVPADAPAGSRASSDASRSGSLGGLAPLVAALVSVGVALGAVAVVVPATAQASGAIALSGPVQATWSVGSLVGGLWYGGRIRAGSHARRAAIAMAWFAAFLALFAVSSDLLWRAFTLLTAGLALAPALTSVLSLVPEIVPAPRLAEAFSWISAAEPAGAALGSWAAGSLIAAGRLSLAGWLPCVGAVGAVAFAGRRYAVTAREALTRP